MRKKENWKQTKNREADILFIKSFLKRKEPDFVIELNLRYEMDYFYGVGNQFIKMPDKLTCKVEGMPKSMKERINTYINEYGKLDDKIYYTNLKTVYLIFTKYYDKDGNLKNLDK